MTQTLPAFHSQMIDTGRLLMHVVCAGPPDGKPVILLHGFPDFWYSFRFQMTALAEAGFYAIAPDQRGYNTTSKAGPYHIDTLTADIAALQDYMGIKTSHLVGHDWGGVVAWFFAGKFPGRVDRLAILNTPHPLAYQDSLRRVPAQWIKSLYILFFQLPRLPEWAFRAHDYRIIERTFSIIPPQIMSRTDIALYQQAASQPGAIRAMLGWYRQDFRSFYRLASRFTRAISTPTRVIWGERDAYLDRRTNGTIGRYVSDLEIFYLPDANHWVQMHDPDRVNDLLIDHFQMVDQDR